MDRNDIAIVVSVMSLSVAALSLGWNIYRDVVVKAKVKVTFGVRVIIHASMPERPTFLNISLTNFGPGVVTLSMIQMKNAPLWRRLLRKTEHAIIMHDYENPLSGKLPKRLEVGERLDLLLAYSKECFLRANCTHIGVSDFFGRVHWAPRSHLRKAKQDYAKAFGSAEAALGS